MRYVRSLILLFACGCLSGEARAQWWVGGDSYSLRVDKYDSFYGEARPIRWSIERPPGVQWEHMLAPKRVIHARMYYASGGYPAVYHAAYPAPYHAGVPVGNAPGYQFGYPVGHPVGIVAHQSHAATWRPPAVQVDPLPWDEDEETEATPYPVEDIPPPAEVAPPPNGEILPADVPLRGEP
jgi:hypothetical protein